MNTQSKLTKQQTKTFKKYIKGAAWNGGDLDIRVTIRYDDQCGNGHNSFSITANGYEPKHKHGVSPWRGDISFGGCCHDEIIKHFPELEKYIKWHFMSSDEPMHYVANTTYHAREKDHENYNVGEAVAWDEKLKFDKSPFTFKQQEK